MNTKVLHIANNVDEAIFCAVEVLRNGGLIAFPTETVYGLGADALNANAVQRVFDVKGRPSTNPLIVHIASLDYIHLFAKEIPLKARRLAEHFWPGPLTLVLNANNELPRIVTAGLNTVAIRVPKQDFTVRLLKEFQGGIVGPSANLSGKPSPTMAEHVVTDFYGKIDLILDDGQTQIGVESTVVDVTVDPPVVLRLGGLNINDIETIVGKIIVAEKNSQLLRRSPGTQFRHYAPSAKVVLIEKENDRQFYAILKQAIEEKKKIITITHSFKPELNDSAIEEIFYFPIVSDYAREVYKVFRKADKLHIDYIIAESVPEDGIGKALMDRLRRAAE